MVTDIMPIHKYAFYNNDYYTYIGKLLYMAGQAEPPIAGSAFDTALDDGVWVKFGKEYASPESAYIFVFCKCRKRDREKFLETIRKLPAEALLLGHKDYLDVCKNVIRTIPFMQPDGCPETTDDVSGLHEEENPSIVIRFLEERKEELLKQVEQSIDEYIFDVLEFIISDPYGESDQDDTEEDAETNTAEENGSE